MRKLSFTKRNRSKDILKIKTDLGDITFKINLRNIRGQENIVIDLDKNMKASITNNSLFLERF